MGLFKKSTTGIGTSKSKAEAAKDLTTKLFEVPSRVQETLPIARIAQDGVFQIEGEDQRGRILFDKAYMFLDTNFATMDDHDMKSFLRQYCAVLNAMNVSFKIHIINNSRDMAQVQKEVFLKREDGKFTELIRSFNDHIENSIQTGSSGIEQLRIFIITCRRPDVHQARDYFRSIEANLQGNFNRMQSALIPLDADERLRLLFNFYHIDEHVPYRFSFKEAMKKSADWKDMILPGMIAWYCDEYGTYDEITLRIDDHYCRALYLKDMPNSVDPKELQTLMVTDYHVILTIDVAPIPTSLSKKRLSDLYLQNERTIEKQQETRNKAGAWSSDVSYDVRKERDELEEYMNIINSNDEKMFYTGIYAVFSASTKAELDAHVTSFTAKASGLNFIFTPAWVQQIDAMNTALPTGARFCSRTRPIFTQPLAGFTPFVVHELYEAGGTFFGLNLVSKNIIVGNRKGLTNGNGFVLGIPGSGKSLSVKANLLQCYLGTKDDIIVIDPQNEYKALCECLDGQYVDFNAEANHHINPLSTDTLEHMDSKRTFLQDKTELMISIYSQITEYSLNAQSKSIIGRVVNNLYENISEKGFQEPTLVDFYQALENEPEKQAASLALALELFISGALDMFAQPTNVNIKNRLTVYGIADLGKEQSAVGMLIMLEGIRSRIAQNADKGVATWLYIDEFHNLANREYSAQYLEKIWKEVRKLGGLCTAITQNIADLLHSKTIETMLCNSEYLCLLKQSDVEVDILHRLLKISNNMLKYVETADPGCGLMRFGKKLIPFDNRIPKDNLIYRLMNTNFFEVSQMRRELHRSDLKKEIAALPEAVKNAAAPEEGEPA